ncbi:Ubiquitin carboxyl-terminal hydrolase 2 [Gracilariopsis chorda]|uniref:Ubiquitin carboxyl-terminal hydrolase n=1 Tax=Gracilariopsis chorda TaxID=448386 RepID=A0A2V3IGQ5_9FLOR|nr:Ubiquitin carboxyl-terminal hydrolase 2 [Gracilariopsis chorda]|eukprot:PXF41203.1 Ubiquitin carboxyl-terminal hydrolase 2 [Gracilariopsis chorda]
MSDLGWCTIESDPGVFTELLSEIGVKNVQVEEVYALDKQQFEQFGHVYGVVFLFKYRSDESRLAKKRPGKLCSPPPETLFFANQTVTNACATQALLSIVMNVPSLSLGAELARLRDFSTGMDSMTKGMVVSNSDVIRVAHNSFAPQHQFVLEDSDNTEKEDPFHFVAYIPHEGSVYELDGLQEGPREHGAYGETGDWLDVVTPIISQRIEEYDGGEIRFNIMVVVEDPRERLQAELDKLKAEPSLNDGRISVAEAYLDAEKAKHEKWQVENLRRRWNFVPFVMNMFKTVAECGQAENLIKQATEKKEKDYERAMEKKGNKQE